MFTGDQIRLYRKKLGLSAVKLAAVLGTSKDNIYKWEKGHRPQSGEDYQKVEDWLNGKVENVPRETESNKEEEPDLKQIIRMQNALIQTQNRILAEIKDGIQDKVSNIEINLNQHRGVVNSIALQVDAVGQEALKSLSRLENRDENYLLKEAGKRIERKMKEMSKQNNMAASGR